MTNKYAEGYPGRRYYGGCQFVDVAETLAIERACRLFGAGFANVQPNSGSQANQAVFLALLQPGDTFLAMDSRLGRPSDAWREAQHVGQVVQGGALRGAQAGPAARLRPGGRAGARSTGRSSSSPAARRSRGVIDFARFREIADDVGAYLMVDMAHFAGLVAGRPAPEPGRRTRMSSPPRRTRPCAGRAAA